MSQREDEIDAGIAKRALAEIDRNPASLISGDELARRLANIRPCMRAGCNAVATRAIVVVAPYADAPLPTQEPFRFFAGVVVCRPHGRDARLDEVCPKPMQRAIIENMKMRARGRLDFARAWLETIDVDDAKFAEFELMRKDAEKLGRGN